MASLRHWQIILPILTNEIGEISVKASKMSVRANMTEQAHEPQMSSGLISSRLIAMT